MFTQALKGGARAAESISNFTLLNWLIEKLNKVITRYSQEVPSEKTLVILTRRKGENYYDEDFLYYFGQTVEENRVRRKRDVDTENIMLTKSNSFTEDLIMLVENLESGETSLQPTRFGVFGLRIGALRRKKEYSLDEIERVTGIDKEILLRIEMGKASLEQVADSIPALAKALDVSSQELDEFLVRLILEE